MLINKVVLITGGSGSFGKKIVDQNEQWKTVESMRENIIKFVDPDFRV